MLSAWCTFHVWFSLNRRIRNHCSLECFHHFCSQHDRKGINSFIMLHKNKYIYPMTTITTTYSPLRKSYWLQTLIKYLISNNNILSSKIDCPEFLSRISFSVPSRRVVFIFFPIPNMFLVIYSLLFNLPSHYASQLPTLLFLFHISQHIFYINRKLLYIIQIH